MITCERAPWLNAYADLWFGKKQRKRPDRFKKTAEKVVETRLNKGRRMSVLPVRDFAAL